MVPSALIASGVPPGAAVLVHTGITSAVAYRNSHARVPLDTAGETCASIP